MQRLHPLGVQTLRPGHTHSVASTSASAQSHLSQVLKTHRDRMEFDPDQLRELKQLVQKITGPRMVSPTPGRPVPRPPTTPKPQTPAATKVGRDRAARRRPQVSTCLDTCIHMDTCGYVHMQGYMSTHMGMGNTACIHVAKPEWHVLSHHMHVHVCACTCHNYHLHQLH